ncbi:tetratricopeptide repeat protein [Leuconostoc pseudomesenteroides]|uniref:tetratricopeptide repeat protein n=1 Tax=Leuconostoc pseudomesenteroides TaxID=33968 RepID=UPI001664E0A5|nr:tetratricopeptide repeat protein [Leuconostoc pseudomesenteroides]WAM39352.1 tetratricopeptide repeat protein [Leuconostoc pseudomesenteroides]
MTENYAEKMLDALSSGQLDTAQKLFAQSLRHDSDEMIYSLAEELYALGFLNQSRRAYKKLLDKFPDEDDIRTALADIAIEDGQIDEAQDYLAQIRPSSPSYLQALLVKADIYQTEGLNESAELSLLQAEKIAPDEVIIQFALAEFYFANQSYHQAIPRYRSLLLKGEREISRVDLVARIGVAYAQIGNYENAVGYLEQIKPEQMTLDTQFQLGVLYQENDRENDAIKLFNSILESDPKYTSIYPLLGQAYEHQQDLEHAYRTYQAGIAQDETNTLLYRLAGLAADKQGDLAAAQSYYQKALALDENDVMTIIAYSELLLSQHLYEEDVQLIEKYIAEDVVDPQFYWDLARAYQALGQDDKANKYWQEAAPFYDDDVAFLHDLVDWYHEQGMREQELVTMKQYLKIAPDDDDMQMRLESVEY